MLFGQRHTCIRPLDPLGDWRSEKWRRKRSRRTRTKRRRITMAMSLNWSIEMKVVVAETMCDGS